MLEQKEPTLKKQSSIKGKGITPPGRRGNKQAPLGRKKVVRKKKGGKGRLMISRGKKDTQA